MSELCTQALNQCLMASHVVQSAVAQCSTFADQLSSIDTHTESHIVHATAVFSELGLAISSASLADPLAWRRTVGSLKKDHPDIIERTNFLSEAKRRGMFSYAVNWLLEWEIKDFFIARMLIIYALPSLCWGTSLWVLWGISFPDKLENHAAVLNEKYFYWEAFLSFFLSFISVYVTRKQFEISGGVGNSLDEVNKGIEIET
jgi:hypothetical protein